MAYGNQLSPGQVQALLSGWYDIVGPQVGQWPGRYHGAYGARASYGYPYPGMYLGADPTTGAPIVAPGPMGPPPAPMGPPPGPMMGPPPAPMGPPPGPMMGPGPMAAPFPPRAALVEAPPPTQANRDILPMSTGVPILPTQSAQITGRPQCIAYKIGCYKISNAGTAGG
ncbi:MAG TPA: hypothetical protein VLE97_05710, partial [Gaiellaceae bacterium]|nr:hypothetical protein [Gaiellaceae bacterium]